MSTLFKENVTKRCYTDYHITQINVATVFNLSNKIKIMKRIARNFYLVIYRCVENWLRN